ncbi:AarF/ABC1/UbiB kinase family protein [Candidatus Woesearchaeota archaeon]|nr:AarF/ABC1/UbiB kinase family protein [Candidatus Woesearchaeota archaeon]
MDPNPHESSIRRIGHVCRILSKEGFLWLIDEIELRAHVPLLSRWFGTRGTRDTRPERIRNLLEQMGGSYIKLGQLLSLRPDLIPEEYCEEFTKLQDRVPPEPFDEIKHVIETELGKPISSAFSEFLTTPIGSASIAQVHEARLKRGERVVVKVMRPGIHAKFKADLDVMYFFAHRLENRLKKLGFNPVTIVEEFEKYTRDELDFTEEGAHIQAFERNFAGSRRVKIPHYHKDLSTKNILVMEYIEGVHLSNLINGSINHHDKEAIARNLFDLCLTQVFKMDIFHADMHPGNIIVLPDNRVALLDFGITGSLPPDIREKGVRLYVALVEKNIDDVLEAIFAMGHISDESKLHLFKQEVREIIDMWHGETLSKARITHTLHQLLNSCVDHGITLPPEFIRLGKALVTIEGTCVRLYPEFNFVEESKPYLVDLLRSQVVAGVSLKNALKKSLVLKAYLQKLPRKIASALERVASGRVDISVEAAEVGYLGRVLSVASDRISAALIIAACLITGGLILRVNVPPHYFGVSAFALIAFGIGAIMTTILLLSFLRKLPVKNPHH